MRIATRKECAGGPDMHALWRCHRAEEAARQVPAAADLRPVLGKSQQVMHRASLTPLALRWRYSGISIRSASTEFNRQRPVQAARIATHRLATKGSEPPVFCPPRLLPSKPCHLRRTIGQELPLAV